MIGQQWIDHSCNFVNCYVTKMWELTPACLAKAQKPLERMRSTGCVVVDLRFTVAAGVAAFTGVDKLFDSPSNVTISPTTRSNVTHFLFADIVGETLLIITHSFSEESFVRIMPLLLLPQLTAELYYPLAA